MELLKPKIYTQELAVFPVDKHSNIHEVLDYLQEGHFVIVEDFYSTGLKIMNALKERNKGFNSSSFKQSHEARGDFRTLSHRVLLEVENHELLVRKAPQIPWLKKFYASEPYFAISYPDVQALNSSWQWYKNGIQIPGLSHILNPWYGVYFPTRFTHIELFSKWLSDYNGNKETAYDIGCGSGILSYILENNGVSKIWASDTNPNAIKNVEEVIEKENYQSIEPALEDLFGQQNKKADLIVFNPPWLPEKTQNSSLDAAVYYPEDLFERFFKESHKRLNPQGKILLLFSNLIHITHPNHPHPIEEELNRNNRFKLFEKMEAQEKQESSKTKRNLKRRTKEMVELWVLEKN